MKKQFLLLCNKNWLETRGRFWVSSGLILMIILYFITVATSSISNTVPMEREAAFSRHVWLILYKGYLMTFFVFSSFMFGLGGLIQEKQNGTALFSLALPLNRNLFFRSKILTAGLEVLGLALVPAIAIPLLAKIFNFYYPLRDAMYFAMLMTSGGVLFMLLGALLSLFTAREFVLPSLGAGIMAGLFFLLRLPSLEPINIFSFMYGSGYVNTQTFLFTSQLNWNGMLICFILAVVIFMIVEFVLSKRDF